MKLLLFPASCSPTTDPTVQVAVLSPNYTQGMEEMGHNKLGKGGMLGNNNKKAVKHSVYSHLLIFAAIAQFGSFAAAQQSMFVVALSDQTDDDGCIY